MTGTVFDNQPTYGDNPTARKRGQPAKQQGDYWVGGYEDRHTPDDTPGEVQGDGPTGTLTSPFFKITGRYITFLVGGGCDANLIHADLIIDGVVRNNVVRALIFLKSVQTAHAFLGMLFWFLYHEALKSIAILPGWDASPLQSTPQVGKKKRQRESFLAK